MMSAQHLMNLVNDILDISKIEAGKLELEQRVFHLPDVLRAAVEIVQVDAVHKHPPTAPLTAPLTTLLTAPLTTLLTAPLTRSTPCTRISRSSSRSRPSCPSGSWATSSGYGRCCPSRSPTRAITTHCRPLPTCHYSLQVLLNLLFNAVKFTPQGRIVVTAAVQQEFANHLRINFSVEDTGIGIMQEGHAY